MPSFDPIPQVRIVRHGGRLVVPPRPPRTVDPVDAYARTALAYVFGLWPLTCVVVLLAGLVVLAANMGSPLR
ncbi:MAG: hypothetical protein E6J91_08000 [Deltaproteobacteria bacterium]|nr:MAG: hypothetical protein E6J91_08000 [Deltaproteobacteria bacterium]